MSYQEIILWIYDRINIYYEILNIIHDDFEDNYSYELDFDKLKSYDEDLYKMLKTEKNQEQINTILHQWIIKHFV